MKVKFYEETQRGSRKNNQDFFAHTTEDAWCSFVVADGLGGHDKGEVASEEFCKGLMDLLPKYSERMMGDPRGALEHIVADAALTMRHKILAKYPSIDAHTTFAFLWLDEKQMVTAHVGDSRIYRVNRQGVVWRTPDHTMVQELFDQGKIKEEDFAHHPYQNRLLKTVHLYEIPHPDIFVQAPLALDETIVLCTDGFWNQLTHRDFVQIAQSAEIKKATQSMVQAILAEHRLDSDNITVQVVRLN